MNEFVGFATYLLLGEFLTSPLFADLMTFVVATGRTVTTIILALATNAFAATFPFLFRLENVRRHL